MPYYNYALLNTAEEQASVLRKEWFPGTTSETIRTNHLFALCIERFSGKTDDLIPYIENEGHVETVQKMVNLKESTNEKLKTIAGSIKCPATTTFRAIIAYTVDQYRKGSKPEENNGYPMELRLKLAELQSQIDACKRTMEQIQKIMMEE